MREGVFTLKISASNSNTLLTWPIVTRSEKAIQLKTTSGEIWISLFKLHRCEHLTTALVQSSDSIDIHKQIAASNIEYFIRFIEQQTQSHPNAIVKVRPAGAGPTTQSRKFKVDVQRRSKGSLYDAQPPKLMERTFTLPVSQIQTETSEHYAPVWLFKDRLTDGETLIGAVWPGLSALKAEIQEAAKRVTQLHHAKLQADSAKMDAARQQREHQAQQQYQEKERLLTKVKADGELALAFCKQKYTLAEVGLHQEHYWPSTLVATDNLVQLRLLERIIDFANAQPQFNTWKSRHAGKDIATTSKPKSKPRRPNQELHNVRVEWAEWQGSKLTRSDHVADGCQVRIFGKKYEITLPDGCVIHKMQGPNLKVTPASTKAV